MTRRWGESGNVFFTLFGAVALVGVVGAATSTLMRGPVGTVVSLNQRAKADSQMQIAMKLAMLEAQNSATADCDSDTLIEPLPPGAVLPGLTNGGQLPSVGSTTNDPWGVAYGYCSWDHGAVIADPGCPAGLRAGENNTSGPVIAIISAGPDRAFGVTCHDQPSADYITRGASGADDIIVQMTYAEANEASGGLWHIKSGDPDQITTGKELDVQQGAQFSSGNVDFTGSTITGTTSFDTNAALDLSSGGLFMLPDETMLTDSECDDPSDNINSGLLRRYVGGGGEVLQICDAVTNPLIPVWTDIGGSGGAVAAAGNNTEVQFNAGGVLAASANFIWSGSVLDITGSGDFSDDMIVGDQLTVGGLADLNGNLDVAGTTNLGGTLDVSGVTDINNALNVTGNTDLGGTFNADGAATLGSTLAVTGNASFTAQALGSDGSAAQPSFTFSSSSSTGIYYTSGGMGFTIGGTNEMTLTSSGLVVDDLTVTNNISADRFLSDMATTSAALPGFQTEPGTGLYSPVDNSLALVTGGSSRLIIDGTGDVGINVATPEATLDVGGEIKVGTSSVPCAATIHGAIRYVSGDLLQVCSSMTNNWEDIGTSGGGGGGAASYWTRISVADPRLYYTDDFVGVGTNDPLTTFHVNGDFLTTGSYTGAASMAVSGAGTRMFFDPESGAFRAGRAVGTEWDNASLGNYSIAMGYDALASGQGAAAIGYGVSATQAGAFALGTTTRAFGAYSMALGLGSVVGGVAPTVTGDQSYGIFMGSQPNMDIQATNTMALIGGRMLVDQSPSIINPSVSGTLSLDVEGGVGAVQYCDEDGTNCFTAASVATGGVGAPGNNREVIFNSGGVLGTNTGFVFSSAGWLGLGTNNPLADVDVSSTGAILLPRGVTGDRPTAPVNGMIRYNSTNGRFEGYQAGAWQDIITSGAGGIAIDDLSDAITQYSSSNMYLGQGSGALTTTGNGNTSLGHNALSDVTSGYENSAIGLYALTSTDSGHRNNAFGAYALADNTTGDRNVAVGYTAMQSSIDGLDSTALGTGALRYLTTGTGNLALGAYAGDNITSGSGNIMIGYDVDAASATGSNQLNIGNLLTGELSNGLLAINGTGALTLPIGQTGDRPGAPVDGMLRYNSVSGKFEGYQAGAWQDILTSAVAGGAAAPDRGIQFNSGGNFAADANFVYSSQGSFMVSGIYTGAGAPPVEGAGTRMFFDPTKSAFRAGRVSGAQWDNANTGVYSAALGQETTASGVWAFATGYGTTASGNESTALGMQTAASGLASTAVGRSTVASGATSTAMGRSTVASGASSTAMGQNTVASGLYSTAMGNAVVAGDGVAASGFGDGSLAVGLIDDAVAITTLSQVRGIQSYGIFMGDQDGLVMTANNTMGWFCPPVPPLSARLRL
ncbi:MAG: hypothetical protein HYS17_09920 [Micavibrio aeruginosavorus]|uniref:Trimeric autotransporter adhesin YadA-like head domain-containing protein n=1 Tax=Micavibrio aeruginosavorus TaxID=349221 RepID=A0A7T5UG28_9BACT|nr:MAG: hypothetical protein HYS17_09920 [Micavibrio aeruginosavorus]